MALTDNTRGALLMMAGMAGFTLNDAAMKGLAGEIPLFQAILIRGIGTSLLLALLAWKMGALKFRLPRRDVKLVIVRTLAEVGAAYFFITALFNMPIANATAILQALPLTVTLAGMLFLREAVGWRRMSAILIGFIGVMLIVRPGPDGFNIYATYALIAVALVTVRDLSARKLSRDVPSFAVAMYAAIGVTLLGALGAATEPWVPVSAGAALRLGGATVFVIGGYLCSVMVMRVGDIGFIAPFRYTSLIWALVLGLVLFGDWPDAVTLLGSAVVVATGLFTLYRERGGARRQSGPVRMR